MHKMNLLQLLKDNAEKPRSWSVKAAGDEATVYVYDVIGGLFGGVDAEQMTRDLSEIEAKTINLRINSPGGDVFEARAIATALKEHPAEVVAHVDGLAASAATTIAMAADRVEISDGGFFMIHNAWTLAIGNKSDMLDSAALLEKVDQAIASDYMNKTGADAEQVKQWMDDETWFTAQEAVEHGFADSVKEDKAKAKNWNLAAYSNAPEIKDESSGPDRAELERRLTLLESCAA